MAAVRGMNIGARVGAIVLTGTLASGCAMGGYNADKLESRLVKVGVPAAAAKCVVDRMTKEFGDNRLGGRADPTADEVAAERALLKRCGVRATPA